MIQSNNVFSRTTTNNITTQLDSSKKEKEPSNNALTTSTLSSLTQISNQTTSAVQAITKVIATDETDPTTILHHDIDVISLLAAIHNVLSKGTAENLTGQIQDLVDRLKAIINSKEKLSPEVQKILNTMKPFIESNPINIDAFKKAWYDKKTHTGCIKNVLKWFMENKENFEHLDGAHVIEMCFLIQDFGNVDISYEGQSTIDIAKSFWSGVYQGDKFEQVFPYAYTAFLYALHIDEIQKGDWSGFKKDLFNSAKDFSSPHWGFPASIGKALSALYKKFDWQHPTWPAELGPAPTKDNPNANFYLNLIGGMWQSFIYTSSETHSTSNHAPINEIICNKSLENTDAFLTFLLELEKLLIPQLDLNRTHNFHV